MAPTKKGHKNTSGVLRETPNGVFYLDGKYICQRRENGRPCNREMAGTNHSITSHNSKFHAEGPYKRQMAEGQYACFEDGCGAECSTFGAILAHVRRYHGFRGSSDPLKIRYGVALSDKGKGKGKVTKKDGRKRGTSDTEEDSHGEHHEEIHKESGQPAGNDHNAEDRHNNYEGYGLIDPALLNWDNTKDGFDDDGRSLLDQVLSVNIFPVTHSTEESGRGGEGPSTL
ncbi:hypothetical protein F5B22DRAFT_623278 [Xylaria bambusicola]|uniref:uncharacterized protein n=1 Tax=Xylaria bambusicola TaxID=326684 RepID=UPI002007FA12|nr:uncharacterized protein F5B22DRAFT_623278 [Xylaria bambusicola]KAI0506493.1 hypothetical protein F5B22DRAFT_623278 [Xylaria bambusicola]